MIQEYAKDLLPLIQAWSEGATLQFKTQRGWEDIFIPSFDGDASWYRIKPEPKWREWKSEEVPLGAQIRMKTSHNHRDLITSVAPVGILFTGTNLKVEMWSFRETFQRMDCSLDQGKTWQPCGVREDV